MQGILNTKSQKRLLGALLGLTILALPAMTPARAEDDPAHTALKIGTSSEKVPSGTLLKITFNSHMDSRVTQPGEPFTAFIAEDFTSQTSDGEQHVILPEGTLVRGRVEQVKKPGLFSHGGSIALNFDHVVLPSGELLPLELNLSTTKNTIVNHKGALYSDPGIGKKVSQGVKNGIGTFDKIKDAGLDMGRNTPGGIGMIVTAPVAVAGGALAGGAVTTEKAVLAVVGKGESIIISPGDTVTIDFGGSFNLPAQ